MSDSRWESRKAGVTRYDGFFTNVIARLQDERRYRVFADLERIAGRVAAKGRSRLRGRVKRCRRPTRFPEDVSLKDQRK